LGTTIYWFT